MKTIKINRNWGDENQTLGNCTVIGEDGKPLFSSLTLERGWRDNQQGVSCIPPGSYPVKLEYSDRFKTNLWEIKGVPNRSECKFHAANYWYQLNGCVALGQKLLDINNDGYNDITSSKNTMRSFHGCFGSDTEAILEVNNFSTDLGGVTAQNS